jgi:hypothetical protein
LLAGRAVEAISITYVGKESNLLEDLENEIVHDWDEVQQQNHNARLDLSNRVLREIRRINWRRRRGSASERFERSEMGTQKPSAKTRGCLFRAAESDS